MYYMKSENDTDVKMQMYVDVPSNATWRFVRSKNT